jgi:hypothetical protein
VTAETAGDRAFRRHWTILALVSLTLPYLVLAPLHPGGGSYTGMLFVPSDTFLYLSQMFHSQQGDWLFRDPFTWRAEPALTIFVLYTLLGKVALGGSPLVLALVFHTARLLLAWALVDQAWKLYGELLPGRPSRRVALIFLLFTAGAGVFALLLPGPLRLREIPFDLSFVESSTFYGLVTAPHFAAVLLLMAVFMRALHRAGSGTAGPASTAVVALSAAGLSLLHPEKVLVVGLAALAYLAWALLTGRTRLAAVVTTCAAMLAAVPYTLYLFALAATSSQVADLVHQGRPHPPVSDPLLYYLLGFGIPGLCALAGLPRLLRHPRAAAAGEVLLWCVVAASLVVLFTPARILDHRAEGMQLAVAGLAGRNLVHEVLPRIYRTRAFAATVRRRLLGYRRRRLRLLALNLVLILSSPSILALAIASPRAGLASSSELYFNPDDPGALGWLRQHASRDDVVAAAPESEQFVAAYTGARVVVGHFDYTPDFIGEAQAMLLYLRGRSDARTYLASRHVRWLYFGPRERDVATVSPSQTPGVTEAFHQGQTTVYAVNLGP